MPKAIIIKGKKIIFNMEELSELSPERMHIVDNIARLVVEDNNGLFLYVDDETRAHPIPPNTTHIIDKTLETLIGFLIFKESAENSIDKINVIEIPHIIPDITDKIKLLLLAVLPFIFFSLFAIYLPSLVIRSVW